MTFTITTSYGYDMFCYHVFSPQAANKSIKPLLILEALTRTPGGPRTPLWEPLLKATAATIIELITQSHKETRFILLEV